MPLSTRHAFFLLKRTAIFQWTLLMRKKVKKVVMTFDINSSRHWHWWFLGLLQKMTRLDAYSQYGTPLELCNFYFAWLEVHGSVGPQLPAFSPFSLLDRIVRSCYSEAAAATDGITHSKNWFVHNFAHCCHWLAASGALYVAIPHFRRNSGQLIQCWQGRHLNYCERISSACPVFYPLLLPHQTRKIFAKFMLKFVLCTLRPVPTEGPFQNIALLALAAPFYSTLNGPMLFSAFQIFLCFEFSLSIW